MTYLVMTQHGTEHRGVMLSSRGERLGRVLVSDDREQIIARATTPRVLERIKSIDPFHTQVVVVEAGALPDALRRELRLIWGEHYTGGRD